MIYLLLNGDVPDQTLKLPQAKLIFLWRLPGDNSPLGNSLHDLHQKVGTHRSQGTFISEDLEAVISAFMDASVGAGGGLEF